MLLLNWISRIRTAWVNWIAWNRNVFHNQTVLTFKLRAYAKLNCLKLNYFWHWNYLHWYCGRSWKPQWMDYSVYKIREWAVTKWEKREYSLWHSRYNQVSIYCLYVVLSNDKLVILTLRVESYSYCVYSPGIYITLNWIVIYNCLNKLNSLK